MQNALDAMYGRLFSLEPATGPDDEPCPITATLTPEGKQEWIPFYNEHARELNTMSGDLAACWSKLEGAAARLAMAIHYVRWAANDPHLAGPDLVDEQSVVSGAILAQWFGREALRVYRLLSETNEDRSARELLEVVNRLGGSATVREVMHACRQYRDSAENTETALGELVTRGWGSWVEQAQATGRPTRRFQITPSGNGNTSQETLENSGVVLPPTHQNVEV